MEPWSWFTAAKIYLVILFFVLRLLARYGLGFYIRRKIAQGVAEDLEPLRQMPASLRWLPVLAGIASLFMYAYALIYIVFPEIENFYLPLHILRDDRIAILGMVLVAVGMLSYVTSELQLGLSYRDNPPAGYIRLVTAGLYSVSRNPLSLGMFVALFGIFLISPNWIFLFCWLVYVINEHLKVTLLEEPFLLQSFGKAYQDYCQRVNRYF